MNKRSSHRLKNNFFEKTYALSIIVIAFLFLVMYFNPTQAQQRLDLDDIDVKGELINDDRLVILSREKNELKNYVKFRANFRSEAAEELPQPAPGIKY